MNIKTRRKAHASEIRTKRKRNGSDEEDHAYLGDARRKPIREEKPQQSPFLGDAEEKPIRKETPHQSPWRTEGAVIEGIDSILPITTSKWNRNNSNRPYFRVHVRTARVVVDSLDQITLKSNPKSTADIYRRIINFLEKKIILIVFMMADNIKNFIQ